MNYKNAESKEIILVALMQEAVDIFLKVEDFWRKHPVEKDENDPCFVETWSD